MFPQWCDRAKMAERKSSAIIRGKGMMRQFGNGVVVAIRSHLKSRPIQS